MWPMPSRERGRRNWVALALLKPARRRLRAATALMAPSPATAAHRSRRIPPISLQETKVDALAIAIGTKPRRLQIHPQAHRRSAGHLPDREIHKAIPTPTWDARLQLGFQGMAGHDQPFGAPSRNLWRARGRPNPERILKRCAQYPTSTPTNRLVLHPPPS